DPDATIAANIAPQHPEKVNDFAKLPPAEQAALCPPAVAAVLEQAAREGLPTAEAEVTKIRGELPKLKADAKVPKARAEADRENAAAAKLEAKAAKAETESEKAKARAVVAEDDKEKDKAKWEE